MPTDRYRISRCSIGGGFPIVRQSTMRLPMTVS
jgi:hypothetical protein